MNPGDGAVPCLELYSPPSPVGGVDAPPTHMFSGSADGSISVWQAGRGWEHLKTMRGHKGSVNCLAVHKSGRIALSVSRCDLGGEGSWAREGMSGGRGPPSGCEPGVSLCKPRRVRYVWWMLLSRFVSSRRGNRACFPSAS